MGKRYTAEVIRIVTKAGVASDSTATLVGDSATAWQDDSDTTYVEMRQSTTVGADFSYGWSEGYFAKDVNIPNAEKAHAILRVRLSAESSAMSLDLGVQAAETTQVIVATGTGLSSSPQWMTLHLTAIEAETIAGHLRDDAAGTPDVSVEVRKTNGVDVTGSRWRVYELYLDFVWKSLHPCRQRPRADGRAASAAKRHYPPDKSLQASPRHAGVYW